MGTILNGRADVFGTLSQHFIYVPQPRDGPVLITIDFQVDETRGREFDGFMNELRLIHLRNGAYSWQLFADLPDPTTSMSR
jgi:hypothetical protein